MRTPTLLLILVGFAIAEEHFLDVRELVKDTLNAIKDVPKVEQNTTAPVAGAANDVYKSLLSLPADIMSRLAMDAGFVEPPKKVKTEDPVKEVSEGEKPEDKDESYSFKTTDDVQVEERRRLAELPTMAKAPPKNDDVFSISRLISATGNAIREAQAQQAAQQMTATMPPLVPLPTPLAVPPSSEIVYRPVVRDGKTVFEQVVLVKSADGSSKIVTPQAAVAPVDAEAKTLEQKKIEIKQVKSLPKETMEAFDAPTFPPMINAFDDLTSTTPTTQQPEVVTKKRLPRRKVEYMAKKSSPTMHSRQFGAKTVQMSDPIDLQKKQKVDEVENDVLEKEGRLRVRNVLRHREVEEQIPKKKKFLKKPIKKQLKKTEIRTIPDLYDSQYKTQVAPSVSKPSESFADEFSDMDEVQEAIKAVTAAAEPVQQEQQQDSPVEEESVDRALSSKRRSPVSRRSRTELTREQVEELLDAEIHKRVAKRIQSARTKSAEVQEDDVTTTTPMATTTEEAAATTTIRLKKAKKTKKPYITKNQCANLRSFARQFLFDSVEDFAKEHCYFIENYYPNLKCAKVSYYVEKCQKYFEQDSE